MTSIVHVEVSGLTGSGKSAVMGEIEIALKALGLKVEHGADFQAEKNGTHADWQQALDLYQPTVVLAERNISRQPPAREDAQPVATIDGEAVALPSIAVDGPHRPCEHRLWLARQLLDSRMSDAEAYSTIAFSPAITDLHPAPDALWVLDTERMLSCLNDLRPSDNKNSRSTTAYNYLLSVIRLAALQAEQGAK